MVVWVVLEQYSCLSSDQEEAAEGHICLGPRTTGSQVFDEGLEGKLWLDSLSGAGHVECHNPGERNQQGAGGEGGQEVKASIETCKGISLQGTGGQ